MKSNLVLASLFVSAVASLHGAAFTGGNLVVSRVGDGVTALANSGGAISLLEYTTSGSAAQTINVPTSSLQWSGTATSEGMISLSKDKSQLTLVGYNDPFTGTGSLPSRTDVQAPRACLNVGADGTVGTPFNVGTFSGNNIRSGVTDGTGVWLAGGTGGTIYNSGSNTTIQSTVANTRVVNIVNGNLCFSTGSGTQGIYGFTGTPTTATAAGSPLIAVGNAYDFTFNADSTVAYVAGNSGAANGFITRYTFSGGLWTAGTTINTGINGVTGLAVDFGAASDTIYAVTPSTLLSLGYTVASSSYGPVNPLASAGTNYAFRGLEFTPATAVPEPASAATLAGLGILGFAASRRRRA